MIRPNRLASAKILQQAGADAVKFEGAHPELVQVLATAGIPVCGHLGYEPQHAKGGSTARRSKRRRESSPTPRRSTKPACSCL